MQQSNPHRAARGWDVLLSDISGACPSPVLLGARLSYACTLLLSGVFVSKPLLSGVWELNTKAAGTSD